MNKPIGVIDSGVGGLTVAKEIMRQLPNETIYYLGDIGRCPMDLDLEMKLNSLLQKLLKINGI